MRNADQHKDLWRARLVVPAALRAHLPAPHTGRKVFLRSTGIPSKGGDNHAAQRHIDEFIDNVALPAIEHAKLAQCGSDVTTLTVERPERCYEGWVGSSIVAARLVGANRLVLLPPPVPRKTGPVDFEEVVRLWIDERTNEGNPPKDKAIKNKRAKMAALFEHARTPDMGEIADGHFRAYRRKLLADGTARDHLIDLKAIFAVAKRGGLITTDPAADLDVPPKANNKRPPFTDDEARRILIAAREAEPVVRWSHWLAAFTTAINSEIMEADASEFYRTEDYRWAQGCIG